MVALGPTNDRMRETNLRFLCSNVRGLICNWSNAVSFDWENYDVVAFNEVWGIKSFENITVNNYEIKTVKLRQNSRGGGTIIFGRKDIACEILETPFFEGCLESTGIKIGTTYFINLYRPPNGNKQEFVDILTQYLDTLGGKKIIIGGDFNLDLTGGNRYIEDICNLYRLEPKIRDCTRIASGTCIDNFITNIDGTYRVMDLSIADHQAIAAVVKTKVDKKIIPTYTIRVMNEPNWLMFNHLMHGVEIRGNTNDSKWDNLLSDITGVVDSSFPKTVKKSKYVFAMSSALLKSRDKKNKLLRKYKQGTIPKEQYILYNNVYRKLIKTAQSKVLGDKLVQAGNDGRKKWQCIKDTLLIQPKNNSIAEIVKNGVLLKEKKEVAEAFKNHFENCATELTEGLPQGHDTSSAMQQGPAWKFKQTTEMEIVEIINSLVNKRSSGHDGLSNIMLKREKYVFARLLKPLINTSLNQGSFPSGLKTANVIPIFKKGDSTNLNNYRPISLLPVISKVFEKILNKQLTLVIDNGYIDENQFGFRGGHSTEDAVLKFIDKLEKDLASKKHVVSIYVDVSKAFDSCDHGIIINKLKRTGLDEAGIQLMQSYLKDRKQIVIVNGTLGGYFVINIGVGQGTVLGPTLFKIYIMDLHLHTSLFCVKFADDSNFEAAGDTKEQVENMCNLELEKISTWFKNNRLTLHPDKSRYLVHTREKSISLQIGGRPIQRNGYDLQEEGVKMLGVLIDENLDWKLHISSVKKKISKANYLLWRHRKRLKIETKKLMYESFVRSHLLYCLTVWGGAKQCNLKPLNQSLRKIWSKIGAKKQHTLNRLKEHQILKIEDELAVQETKLVWKWDKQKLPPGTQSLIIERVNNLRGRHFDVFRNSKACSINNRLAKRAGQEVRSVMTIKSKKTVVSRARNKILESKYSYTCSNRTCYICRV